MDIPVQKLPLKPSDCFQNITGFCIYFKTISPHSSENCGLGCAPAIFVQFFRFLLQSSVPVLGFTYCKALEHYRILDYVTSVIIPLFKWLTIFTLSAESGPGYFTPAFSIMHNFFSRLSIYVEQTVNITLIPCYYSAVKICFKTFIRSPKFCVQRL